MQFGNPCEDVLGIHNCSSAVSSHSCCARASLRAAVIRSSLPSDSHRSDAFVRRFRISLLTACKNCILTGCTCNPF